MIELDAAKIIELLGSTRNRTAPAVDAIQRFGLRALISGTPISTREVASSSALSEDEVRRGIDDLQKAGRIELDNDTIIGVGGLTSTTTAHELQLPDAHMHTWCALDAIGIPIAFDINAALTTSCPYCDQQLQIQIYANAAQGPDGVVLFCPTGPCHNVRTDFCTSTNLFCNPGHLAAWRHNAGKPEGAQLSLDDTVDLGRKMWTPHNRQT